MDQLLATAGPPMAIEPWEGEVYSLKELQGFVGGLIELVRLGGGRLMVVNEEGRLKGLPFNLVASLIAKRDIFGDVAIIDDGRLE